MVGNYLFSGQRQITFEGFIGNWSYIEKKYDYYRFLDKHRDLVYIRPNVCREAVDDKSIKGEKFNPKSSSELFRDYVENKDYFYGLDAETKCLIQAREEFKVVSIELEKEERDSQEVQKAYKKENSSIDSSQSSTTDSSASLILSPKSLHQATQSIPIGSKVNILDSSNNNHHFATVISTPTTSKKWYRVSSLGIDTVPKGTVLVCRERALEVVEANDELAVSIAKEIEAEVDEAKPTSRKRGRPKKQTVEPPIDTRCSTHSMPSSEVSLSTSSKDNSFLGVLQQMDIVTLDMEAMHENEEIEAISNLIISKCWKLEDLMISRLKHEGKHDVHGYMLFNRCLDKVIILRH